MNYHCPRPPKQPAFDTSLLMWRRRFLSGTAFSPASLFASGEDGGWYDPSDLTSMFEGIDGSGGNPSVGDPVGVVLDKSQMGGQTAAAFISGQPELISTDVGDWSRGFLSVDGTLTYASGVFTHTLGAGDTSAARWVFPFSTVVGRTYRVSAIIGGTGSFATLGFSSNSDGTSAIVSSGNPPVPGGVLYQVHFKATATTTYVAIGTSGTTGQVTTVSGLSVKEIPGNHLVAPALIQRPVLRDEIVDGTSVDVSGQPDLISGAGLFNDAALWTGSNWVISGGQASHSVNATDTLTLVTPPTLDDTNKWYLLSIDKVAGDLIGPGVSVSFGGFSYSDIINTTTSNAIGTYSILLREEGVGNTIRIRKVGNTALSVTYDNFIIREVPASAARRYYLDFDGTDDRLATTGYTGGASSTSAFSAINPISDSEYVLLSSNTVATNWVFIAQDGSTSTTISVGAGSPTYRLNGTDISLPVSRDTLHTTLLNVATVVGIESFDTTEAGWQTIGLFSYPPAYRFDGNWYGTVLIDRDLTTAERENLEIFLANKSGAVLA